MSDPNDSDDLVRALWHELDEEDAPPLGAQARWRAAAEEAARRRPWRLWLWGGGGALVGALALLLQIRSPATPSALAPQSDTAAEAEPDSALRGDAPAADGAAASGAPEAVAAEPAAQQKRAQPTEARAPEQKRARTPAPPARKRALPPAQGSATPPSAAEAAEDAEANDANALSDESVSATPLSPPAPARASAPSTSAASKRVEKLERRTMLGASAPSDAPDAGVAREVARALELRPRRGLALLSRIEAEQPADTAEVEWGRGLILITLGDLDRARAALVRSFELGTAAQRVRAQRRLRKIESSGD